ncbi:RNA polymerase sigma factor [Flavisolibacter sp. BT320]|nr:RNA polymerase sigma factor [Flavisolibacter longurius]
MQREPSAISNKITAQLAAIKQNDDAALKALYQENFSKVERYVLANNGTAEEAKDIYQEAFIAVWRNVQLDKFSPAGETSLAGYLYQVARNKWLDHLRSGQYKKVVPLDGSENGTPLAEELPGNQQAYLLSVRKAFADLGTNCRDLLQRFYFRQESLRTIAGAFSWSEATAKNNKYRCLQQLRQLIKKG